MIEPTPRGWTALLRAEFGDDCFYCGRVGTRDADPDGRAWHLDHVYPLRRGGPNRLWNLALACSSCNLSKWSYSGWGFVRRCQRLSRPVAWWWHERPTQRPDGHPSTCRCGACTFVALGEHPVPDLSPNPETGRVED
jgi:hypothetical protein